MKNDIEKMIDAIESEDILSAKKLLQQALMKKVEKRTRETLAEQEAK